MRGVFSAAAVAAGNVCGMRRMRSSAQTSFRLEHIVEIKEIGWDLIWRVTELN